MKGALVSVLMGSANDSKKVQPAIDILEHFSIKYEFRALSAHRTPNGVAHYVSKADKRGVDVFIGAAGLAAALPGVMAAHTQKPVIGLPIEGGSLRGMDSLLSIVQMPPGIPVATVGVNMAKNAGLLAVSILSLSRPQLAEELREYRQFQTEAVDAANKAFINGELENEKRTFRYISDGVGDADDS